MSFFDGGATLASAIAYNGQATFMVPAGAFGLGVDTTGNGLTDQEYGLTLADSDWSYVYLVSPGVGLHHRINEVNQRVLGAAP